MRRLLTFLAVSAALLGLAWWLAGIPGMVDVQVGTVAITTRTPVAILVLAVLFAVIYIVLRLLAAFVRLPARSRRLKQVRTRRRGEQSVTRTLLALASGDAQAARTEAQRSRTLLGDTPQNLLLAAYAARQAGDTAEAEKIFTALAERKDASFLGLRGLYQGAVARGDWSTANMLARRAESVNPGAPWLRTERGRLAMQDGRWHEVLELAGPDQPIAALATAAAGSTSNASETRRLAQRAWKHDPSFTPGAVAYANALRKAGRETKAQQVLQMAWAKAPHPDLAAASLAGGTFNMSRAARAEWLASAAPDHPESHFLRAQAALEAGKLAIAREQAKAALDGGLDQQRVWLLIATIAEKEGNTDAASDALRRASRAEPDPQWRCESCGTAYLTWQPSCGHCGAVGLISWGKPGPGDIRPRLLTASDAILP